MNAPAPKPDTPLVHLFWRACFYLLHIIVAIPVLLGYRFRAFGQHRIPRTGGVLFVSNHQSFLDPVMFGFGAHFRGFSAFARSTLWNNRIVGMFLNMLRTIPVNRGEADRKAIQTAIDTLRAGRTVLLYPEGTRSPDEQTQAFKPGVSLIIRRAQPCVVVPVAIHGTFQIWSRWRKAPNLTGRAGVLYGKPIPAEVILAMKGDEASEFLRTTVESCRKELVDRLEARRTDAVYH